MNKINDTVQKALDRCSEIYKKVGLSDEDIKKANEELEPIFQKIIISSTSELSLPSNLGLSPEQIAGIIEAHTKSVLNINSQHAKAMGEVLCIIAGIVGRQYYNPE